MIDLNNIGKYRENNRLEAKKSVGGLPHSIWESYSAFANTLGGIILLGVIEQEDKSFASVKLPNPKQLMEEFLCLVSDPSVVSANILSDNDVRIEQCSDHDIVVIEVPQAKPQDRPVYCGTNPFLGTFFRDGDGDYLCSSDKVEQLLLANAPTHRCWFDDDSRLFNVFDKIDGNERPHFPTNCPVCKHDTVHFYCSRHSDDTSRAGAWVWCSNCRHFIHASVSAPGWWSNHPDIPQEALAAIPGMLDKCADTLDQWINSLPYKMNE